MCTTVADIQMLMETPCPAGCYINTLLICFAGNQTRILFNSNVGTQVEGSFRILTPDTQVRFVLCNSDDPKMVFDHLTNFFLGVLVHFSLHVDFHSVAQLQPNMILTLKIKTSHHCNF